MSRKQEKAPEEKAGKKDLVPTAETLTPPDASTVLDKIEDTLTRTRVTYGSNDNEFDNLVGKTVASVRASLSVPYNLPNGAQALVNGEAVDDTFVLTETSHLEFSKASGSKGVFYSVTP